MSAVVEAILEKSEADRRKQLKSIEVDKPIELEIDEGNLLAFDLNPLDAAALQNSNDRDDYLLALARDNTQLLLNKIWKLPTERVEEAIVAKLPASTHILPREKPIPKPRPETKWEQYAKLKGIQRKKRGRMIFDEEAKDWRPRWGYKRANDQTKDWAIEVPANADPYEDQFEKRSKAKQERVSKNEYQRLRNIARAKKVNLSGVLPGETRSKDSLHRALTLAKRSTASIGKFTKQLPKETEAKHVDKERKVKPNPSMWNVKEERTKQLELLERMQKTTTVKPKLDVTKAVNRQINEEQHTKRTPVKEGRKSKTQTKKAGRKKSRSVGFGKAQQRKKGKRKFR